MKTMALNSPLSYQELNNLSEVLTEALDIEKCSICLENVDNAILLWPCTHWFCKECITKMRQSNHTDGRKMMCPLCKKSADRRKVLSFDDQQKEYVNCLQSLIGALSLDLGFDITTYKKQEGSSATPPKHENLKPNQGTSSSPVRKIKRFITKPVLDKSKNDINKRITRRSNKNLAMKNETVKTSILASPPKTPDNSFNKEIKVKNWLDSTKFSQAEENSFENVVVVDVHKPENCSLVSEEQLESVTQLDNKQAKTPFTRKVRKKPPNTPSDIDAIKPFDTSTPIEPTSKINKNISVADQFDELISDKRKFQTIKTTYGDSSSTRKRRRIIVESDIFKSVEVAENDKNTDLEDSQKSLEDFSSGSGEEWTLEKSKRIKTKSLMNTRKVTPKKKENETQRKSQPRNIKRKSTRSSFTKLNKTKPEYDISVLDSGKLAVRSETDTVKNKFITKTTLENIAKKISDDWDESVDVAEDQLNACDKSLGSNVFKVSTKPAAQCNPLVQLTPKKGTKIRSPGWSRLKSTKKEFHMSEKKKLSLKTLNKSKLLSIGDLGIKSVSSIVDDGEVNEKKDTSNCSLAGKVELKKNALQIKSALNESRSKEIRYFQPNNMKKIEDFPVEKASEVPNKSIMLGSFNKSVSSSSSSDSPFKGFVSLEVREELIKSSMLKDSIVNCNDFKETTHILPTSKPNFKDLQIVNKIEEPRKTILGNFNKSVSSSSSDSPFKGFESPEIGKDICAELQNQQVVNKMPTNIRQAQHDDQVSKNKFTYSENRTIPETKSKPPLIYSMPCKANNFAGEVNVRKEDDHLYSDMIAKQTTFVNQTSTKITNIDSKDELKITKRKQDRDSGIHNISSPGSPVRKKMLIDAEVQTSPTHVESFIKFMVQSIWGLEMKNVLDQALTVQEKAARTVNINSRSNIPQTFQLNKPTDKNSNTEGCSQDSDKENAFIPNKISIATDKFLNDSDIILGTEELAGLQHKENLCNKLTFNSKEVKTNIPKTLEKCPSTILGCDVDPDAPTQPYKTPLVPKQTLATPGGTLFSAISNPSESELKKLDKVFENDEVLYPEETPKTHSHWQDSGIDQLVELTETKGNHDPAAPFSSKFTMKEKCNRSRRQLDFIGEDSNDMFEIGMYDSKALAEKEENNVFKEVSFVESDEDIIEKDISVEEKNSDIETHKLTPDEDRLSTEDEICSGNIIAGTAENESAKNTKVMENVCGFKGKKQLNFVDIPELMETNHEMERIPPVLGNPEDSNTGSEASIVEGTPDVSQDKFQPKSGARDRQASPKPPEHFQMDKVIPNSSKRHSPNKKIEDDVALKHQRSFKGMSETSKQVSQKINQQQVAESEEQDEEQSCFASSLLSPQQNQVLMMMCRKFNIQFSKTIGPHITHLIVGTKNGKAQNTYKFLYAMALHKPIIKFEWVQEVMRLGRALPLDPFIAQDASGEYGVVRAQEDTKRELLKDFAIHTFNTVDAVVQREQIEELIRLCGGLVVTRLDQFHMIPRDRFRIILIADTLESQPGWREQYNTVEVSIDWIYNSIGRYRVVPLPRFMDDSTEIIPFLLRQGYPPELIEETLTQASL